MKNSFLTNLLQLDSTLPQGRELSRSCLITIRKPRDLEVLPVYLFYRTTSLLSELEIPVL